MLGLIFDMIGVYILFENTTLTFKLRRPKNQRSINRDPYQEHGMQFDNPEDTITKNNIRDYKSKRGLKFIFAGFLLQLIACVMSAI
jgi:hypothetical protein